MIEEINKIIVREKQIIQNMHLRGQSPENINELVNLNNQLQNSLFEIKVKNKVVEPVKAEMKVVSEKTDVSFLQSKELASISNKIFGRRSEALVPKMEKMRQDLQKANSGVLLQTFLSIVMFVTSIVAICGIIIFLFLFVVGIVPITYIWTILIPPLISLLMFYTYPSSEAIVIQRKISNELPFATIHMAAIAGSDMEPTQIFQIIAMSKEYGSVGKELKKVLNQVNIYGYDLLTSLTNVAKTVSNKKLSELLQGLATNISSGGSLKVYLEKKAETYLLDYKLERKQYIEMAGTFMDIYISILIAAPLIMMLMFIIMSVANLDVGGMSLQMLLFLTVGIVVVMNIIFIFVLNFKQPST